MDLYKSRTVQRAAHRHRQDKLAYYHGLAESCASWFMIPSIVIHDMIHDIYG